MASIDSNSKTLQVDVGSRIRQASPEEIEQAVQTQNYQPVLKKTLLSITRNENNVGKFDDSNDIVSAVYTATLTSESELNGELKLNFSERESSVRRLGPTNLRNLQFYKTQQSVTLGKTANKNSALLVPPETRNVEGFWQSQGIQQSGNVIFDLQLPLAVINKFQLTTPEDVLVTSPNSLVLNAIPSSDSESKQTVWTLFPSRSGRLTISCSNRSSSSESPNRNITSQADYQIQPHGCEVRWNLNLPRLPLRSKMVFQFSRSFTPEEVIGAGQVPLPFSWDASKNLLTVETLEEATMSAIVIAGGFAAPDPKACSIPVLNSGRWYTTKKELQGGLELSLAMLRVSISSEMTVQDSTLSGLMETDVEFTADGSQRLTLEQFAQPASAGFQLLIPKPVLQDEVVTQTTEEPGQIETLIRIENRSGVAEQIRYLVPREYRVTAVRELDTQLPLLFRIVPGDTVSNTQPIEIFFRRPLARGAQQLLQLKLQSTANEVSLADTEVSNSDYLRLTDAVVFKAGQLPTELRDVANTPYSEFRSLHPWVPAANDLIVFDRLQLPRISKTVTPESVFTAAIEHTLTVADGTIREAIQIQLAAAPSLPTELILQTAGSGSLKLAASDRQLGYSLQKRISSRTPNEWILRLPQNESRSTATLSIECLRAATGRHTPMLISLPSVSVRTANLRLIAPNANWSLVDADGQAVTDAIRYPDRELETSLRIQVQNTRDRSKQIRGIATWLLNSSQAGLRGAVLVELTGFGLSDRISLDIGDLTANKVYCRVNDHQTEPEKRDGKLDVLLPEEGQALHIQILIQNVPVAIDSAGKFHLPPIQFENESLPKIDTLITPPTGQSVTAASKLSFIRIKNQTAGLGQTSSQSMSSDLQHFRARLAFQQARVDSLFLQVGPDNKTPTLTLRRSQSLLTGSIVAGCILILLVTLTVPNGPTAWVVTGIGILLAQSVGIAFPNLTMATSITTAAFAAAGFIVYLKDRPKDSAQVSSKPEASVGLTLGIGLALLSFIPSSTEAGLPQVSTTQATQNQQLPSLLQNEILTLEQDSPVVFVPPELALRFNSPPTTAIDSPIFLDSQVTINLLTKDAISATVTCHLAVDSAIDQQVELPIEDVTLINCALNGQLTLPIKCDSGKPGILVPAIPQPAATLAPNANVVAAPMKGWIAGFLVYELTYTVRMVAKSDMEATKTSMPVPPAPLTEIIVRDQTESVTEAKLLAPEPTLGVRLGSEFNYPTFSNLSRVDVQFQFTIADVDNKKQPQQSEISARVFASPTGLKIDCEYEVRPIDTQSESVRLARLNMMNLVRAETADGSLITPSIDDSAINIPTIVDRQGLQRFKAAWQMPLSFVQQIDINTKELRELNRTPADRLVLIASTSDRFTIGSIRTQQEVITPISDSQRPANLELRQNEQAYIIPPDQDTVTLQLVRQLETREASLDQSAVVARHQIYWNCQADLQIPDEPIFRQTLSVSAGLKVQSVTASSEDIDRLQSWYQDGDQLVVCLREATRGELSIVISGVLPRKPQLDTALPVITLPEPVEILESSLSLSAADSDNVFIRSLNGTTPDSQFQTEIAAVPTTAIRLTVTDETKPLIIRAEPTKAATASAVALLSNQDNQTQITIFMAFKAVESPFRLQFSRPSNVAYATSKVLLLPAEGRVISSNEIQQAIDITASGSVADNDLSVVAMTGIVPAMTSSILTIPLPTFDVPCEFESFEVLDGRDQNGVTAVPRWIRNILPELPEATSPGNTNPLSMTVSEARDQIRIQLPIATSPQDKRSVENIPAYAISTHNIQGDEYSIEGTFSTLAFSPTSNATLEIMFPARGQLMQLRVDGQPAPFKTTSKNKVIVKLVDRVCLVEIKWLHSVPKNSMLRSSQVELPALSDVENSVFINQNLPQLGWRPRNVSSNLIDVTDLLTEITSGLQMIGTGQGPSIPELLDPNQAQQNLLTNDPAWIELRSQSMNTATAYAESLRELQNKEAELLLSQIDSPNPVIEIREQFPASSLIIILAAVGMVIAGLTTHSSSKAAVKMANTKTNVIPQGTEGSTEIYKTTRR